MHRTVQCPSCHRMSLLVREDAAWCFAGCSIFVEIARPVELGAGPSSARAVQRALPALPPAPVSLVRSAPRTATPRPVRKDTGDWDPVASML